MVLDLSVFVDVRFLHYLLLTAIYVVILIIFRSV